MTDTIMKLGESLLQCGQYNDRIYLLKLSKTDLPTIVDDMHDLALKNSFTKIICKVPTWAKDHFEKKGYEIEAHIPNFYMGCEDVYYMSYYFDKTRKAQRNSEQIAQVIDYAKKMPQIQSVDIEQCFSCSVLTSEDALEMSSLYKRVFETYPFPIFDPSYLRKTMEDNIVYFGIREKGQLVALSSCEMDSGSKNVEMTDFATRPEYQSKGLASFLLLNMEREMRKRGILLAYTIARSLSYGMNITFASQAYEYSGTLINNTNISGAIESMNVWYKPL